MKNESQNKNKYLKIIHNSNSNIDEVVRVFKANREMDKIGANLSTQTVETGKIFGVFKQKVFKISL